VTLSPESLYVVPARTTYRGESEGVFRHFYVHFHTYWQAEPGIYSLPLTPLPRRIIKRVIGAGPEAIESLETTLDVYQLLCHVLRRFPREHLTGTTANPKLHAAFILLQQRAARGMSNAELAAVAGMSVNSFIREFRRTYGTTPNHYLQIIRVNSAATRLQQTDDSLDEIAELVGFCDRYHLSRSFKKVRNISPAAFRRLKRV